MLNLSDEEIYERIKNEMTLEEALNVRKEAFLKGMNQEEYSDEEALKSGKATFILEHYGLSNSYTNKLYESLIEDKNGKYSYPAELDS